MAYSAVGYNGVVHAKARSPGLHPALHVDSRAQTLRPSSLLFLGHDQEAGSVEQLDFELIPTWDVGVLPGGDLTCSTTALAPRFIK